MSKPVRRTRFDRWPCSIARTVDVLGDHWTPLLLREAFYGSRRFDEFARLGIARNVLAARLDRLVDEGILARTPYQDRPVRHEYRLTPKGRELFAVLAAMMRWGDDWLAGVEGPPIVLLDRRTGRRLRPIVVDEETGQPIEAAQVQPVPGPGLPDELRSADRLHTQ
jgi:DNA-binding HxlR family transcriptional regulator